MAISPEAARWFESQRGIKKTTLEAFRVTTEAADTVVFPYPGGAKKYRRGFEKIKDDPESRKFWWDPPTMAGQVPFLPPEFDRGTHMFLVEGETDTMALWQNAPSNAKPRVVGISGTGSWKDNYAEELFGEAKIVWVIVDNDDPYTNPEGARAGEKFFAKVRAALGRKARRVVLPQGIKDVAEFFQRYEWSAFRVLLEAAAEPKIPYPILDLSKEPGEVDWLLEGLLANPDINVLWGDGGVSKSLLSMGLAVAIAEERDEFLGLPLKKHGPVLYIDEENPEDVVRSRLKKLGLTAKGKKNLKYVWYGHVRLDEEPEKLIEAVTEIGPVLLAIDSFSRIQIADENSANDMNAVFTKAIYPVARDLKTAVVALHHASKAGYIRGNTAIRNAADLSLKVAKLTVGGNESSDRFVLHPDKPRRGQNTTITYQVIGYDEQGEPTTNLDKEVRLELVSQVNREPY